MRNAESNVHPRIQSHPLRRRVTDPHYAPGHFTRFQGLIGLVDLVEWVLSSEEFLEL